LRKETADFLIAKLLLYGCIIKIDMVLFYTENENPAGLFLIEHDYNGIF